MKPTQIQSKTVGPGDRFLFARILGCAVLLCFVGSASASAVFDIYVLRKGDGVAVTNDMQAHHIDHFSGSADSVTLTNSWAAPSTDPDTRITQGGDFSTYSQLTRSVDGNYLTFMGRSAEVGGSGGDTDHVVGMFNLRTQTFDTSTRVLASEVDQRGGRGFRSGISTDGNDIWFTGRNQRAWHTTLGSDTATDIARNWQYNRIGIHGGDLFISRRAGTTHGLHRWDGLPTDEPTDEVARFADLGTGWDSDNGQYGDFAFVRDYLFITSTNDGPDDISVYARGDGPDEWNRMTGPGQTLTESIEGMPMFSSAIDRGDHVQLFYSNDGGGDNNALYSVMFDLENEAFGTPIHLADAGEGYGFAGVVAVPEPSTYALLFGLGTLGVVLVIRRRRRPGKPDTV